MTSWLQDELCQRRGAVSFRDFMELALYHPSHGYYTAGPVRVGRDGDYLTAPTASPWYGRVMAALISRCGSQLGPLRLVDAAAGDGSWLDSVLGHLAHGVVHESIAVERSPSLRQLLTRRLSGTDIVDRLRDPSTRPTVLHACELYDALPVHRVIQRSEGLRELWVVSRDDGLVWDEREPAPQVVEYFEHHRVKLCVDQVAEANLAARPLHREFLAAAGRNGLATIVDYGYEAPRLYDPRGRRGGSLSTYRNHRMGRDPLEAPGDQDLTAHVNWNDLRDAAADVGWREIALMPLAEFLVRSGIADVLEAMGVGPEANLDARTLTARQEIKRLLDPEGMGSDLKVLIQASGAAHDVVRSALGF